MSLRVRLMLTQLIIRVKRCFAEESDTFLSPNQLTGFADLVGKFSAVAEQSFPTGAGEIRRVSCMQITAAER